MLFLGVWWFSSNVLFRELGGEDGALGIATTRISKVATLFDEVGVLHYCREGMHAERLLDSILFQKAPEGVTEEKMMQANAVTDEICCRMEALKCGLNSAKIGIQPLILTRSGA
ncbi:glycosyl transferase, family 2 protein-3 [Rodentibacter pneumotropicus]|uniref:Glycosyl transferase, family 2 protein-3 n=1 Tax=Rodentibacter pneumotropicus TaxID=758 RepID=A0A3S4XRL9_9PAST|nr:glycosyl transferase, family 2 protein-3 [Rodentibacter pneumotropicus]